MIHPKQKAQDLHIKFYMSADINMEQANELAIVAVDEILEATITYKTFREKVEYSRTGYDSIIKPVYSQYWRDVKGFLLYKKEIEKNIKDFCKKHK